ncbi:MAG: hypothetical protein JWL97_1167 [Gemmatimonadales bacterium]|nr:hypothetical protein [Gemmatimonadales bacterium]
MEHRADHIVAKAQYPLSPWFAPGAYVFCTGMVGVVFGSVLIAAVRAYHWDLGLRVAGSAGVVLMSTIAAWIAHRLIHDTQSLTTDHIGLTMSVGGNVRRVDWSEITGVTRIENRGTISFDLETDAGPVKIWPQRYRDPEGLLEVLLKNLSPGVVWRDD